MKKLILLALTIVLITSCEKPEKRYTQQSPEIDSYKMAISNYNGKTYDTAIYADTSKTFFNSNKGMSSSEVMAYHKQNDAIYSSRAFEEKGQEYEMVTDDKGRTWVNFWGNWKGTLAGTDKEIEIPIHLTSQYINGKIVREFGYWDNGPVILAMQEIEAAKKLAEAENVSAQ